MFRAAALLLVACLLGCSREEPIRVYEVPKAVEPTYRILGGIFPADNPAWFFKLTGHDDELAKHADDFAKLMQSVSLPNGPQNMPVWTLPDGWKLGGANQAKMASETILFGREDKPFTITVTRAMGGLDENLARWAGQVGVTLDKSKHAKLLGGDKPTGWLVDLTGPNNPTGGRGMMPGR